MSKKPSKRSIFIKIKFVDNINLFKQSRVFKNITYFPIQKSLKILPNISSTSTFPTIIPK